MEPRYEHHKHEERIYRLWEESGALTPPPGNEAAEKGLKPFTIIMPPPNANDPLHVGHAMFVTVEDILIRYHRMLGEAALWLPGTDHAGIETQYVYEKKLQKEGKSRFNFDRESLYQQILSYTKENSGIAIEQMKRLGASADWSRTRFTLDPKIVDLVITTFEKMHREELVYRGLRLVHYCVKCGTGFSELEVNHVETTGKLYYLKYSMADKDGYITVATTRPETLFGDVAVAVNPEDRRYRDLIGKTVLLPIVDREIPVIADSMVEMEFGTGAVKITPFHDFNDFEVWQRHQDKVPEPQRVFEFNGKLNGHTGPLSGTPLSQAREATLKLLEEKGLVEKTTEHKQSVGHCYRCGRVIEPLPLAQFFVKVEGLAKEALKALDEGETKILGTGYDKVLRHWLDNLKDWNISRQIVWGIRMPVWYRVSDKRLTTNEVGAEIRVGFLDKEGRFVEDEISEILKNNEFETIEKGLQTLAAPVEAEYVISRQKPEGEGLWLQETDTFDTWFSSSQWPAATLKTGKEGDFDFYYPTQVMETAYDILMFWVMRMMLMGLYITGQAPFSTVYLHGLVRDEKGQKMSKSKGNVINPLELVDGYGADALRMALVMSTTPGNDSAVGESKVKGMRNFSNKIWNAARFIKMNREVSKTQITSDKQVPNDNDQKFKRRLEEVVLKVTDELERLKIGQAAETVHNEFWHWFCDEEIERAKAGELAPEQLEEGLKTFLKLLHPFVPFVTEAVWQELYGNEDRLIVQAWPKSII